MTNGSCTFDKLKVTEGISPPHYLGSHKNLWVFLKRGFRLVWITMSGFWSLNSELCDTEIRYMHLWLLWWGYLFWNCFWGKIMLPLLETLLLVYSVLTRYKNNYKKNAIPFHLSISIFKNWIIYLIFVFWHVHNSGCNVLKMLIEMVKHL
jgi:hypothetical protein